MKVLIVSPCDLPVPAVKGGAVETLIESLIKINEKEQKMSLTVVSSYNNEAEIASQKYTKTNFKWLEIPKGIVLIDSLIDKILSSIKISKMSKGYLRKIYVILLVKKILVSNEYDKVVFQNSGYLLKVTKNRKVLKKNKGNLYYHLHNDIAENTDKDALQNVNLILISEYLKGKIENLCNKSALERCYVVKNGINVEKYQKSLSNEEKQTLLQQLKIQNKKRILIFVGRISPEKGISEVLDAMEILNEEYVLLVIGSTFFGSDNMSDFERDVQRKCCGLGERVVFTGYIHNSELWKYYKLANLAVLPSMCEEGAGLTMIESIMAGTPVLTTYSGGLPEYLNSNQAIFLEKNKNIVDDIAKSVEYFFDNEKEWCERTKTAQKCVQENYSEESFYVRFINCLENN